MGITCTVKTGTGPYSMFAVVDRKVSNDKTHHRYDKAGTFKFANDTVLGYKEPPHLLNEKAKPPFEDVSLTVVRHGVGDYPSPVALRLRIDSDELPDGSNPATPDWFFTAESNRTTIVRTLSHSFDVRIT